MTDEMKSSDWAAYKTMKALALSKQGYRVTLPYDQKNWMDIDLVKQRLLYVPVLQATALFFNEPSKYGINQGKVSKLSICEVPEPGKKPIEVFNFDRGLDFDKIKSGTPADDLYQAILKELN